MNMNIVFSIIYTTGIVVACAGGFVWFLAKLAEEFGDKTSKIIGIITTVIGCLTVFASMLIFFLICNKNIIDLLIFCSIHSAGLVAIVWGLLRLIDRERENPKIKGILAWLIGITLTSASVLYLLL